MILDQDTDVLAANLLNSVKWHKEHCKDSECTVSIMLLAPVYKALIKRDLHKEEEDLFF